MNQNTRTGLRPLVAGALLAAFAIIGSPPVAAAELRVGFVDVDRVLEKAPQAAQARTRIESEFAPRERELLARQKEVRGREDRLLKNAAVMSASERQRQEEGIRKAKRDLRRSQDEFREDLNLRRSQELSKLQRKVVEVIRALAKSDGFDIVLMNGVVFASERVEVTGKALDALRGAFKRAGG